MTNVPDRDLRLMRDKARPDRLAIVYDAPHGSTRAERASDRDPAIYGKPLPAATLRS